MEISSSWTTFIFGDSWVAIWNQKKRREKEGLSDCYNARRWQHSISLLAVTTEHFHYLSSHGHIVALPRRFVTRRWTLRSNTVILKSSGWSSSRLPSLLLAIEHLLPPSQFITTVTSLSKLNTRPIQSHLCAPAEPVHSTLHHLESPTQRHLTQHRAERSHNHPCRWQLSPSQRSAPTGPWWALHAFWYLCFISGLSSPTCRSPCHRDHHGWRRAHHES